MFVPVFTALGGTRVEETARPGGRMSLSRTVSKPLNPASVIAPRRAAGGRNKRPHI